MLRYVAASDVAGRLIMSVEQFEKTALEGTTIKSQADLNAFIENASDERKSALGAELGIREDEWDALKINRFNEAITAYRESGKADAYKSRIEAVNKAKSVDESAAKKKIPSAIGLGDGKVERYKTDKVDIAVYRNGDSFVVYDYNENAPSRALSRAEVNSVLEQMKSADSAADVAKTLKTADISALTSINQKNMQVSGESEALSPSARMAKDVPSKITTAMSEEEQRSGVEVAEFIEAVNKMIDVSKQTKRKKRIGTLSNNHVSAINSLMKTINPAFDATGYELWIDGTGARHIEIRHGKNGKADKSMAPKEAKEMIPWAAQNAERGDFIKDKNGEISLSDRFFNGDGSRAPEIRLEKSTPDGTVYISECVPDSANKRIWITSAYVNKNGSKGQLLNIEDTSSPQPTPEASFDSNATDISIPDSDEKVNTSDENSSEKSSKEKISELKERINVKKIDAYCRENIEEYASMSAPNQSMIRQVVREGRVYGLDDADILSYARVAARTGLNIVYDENLDAKGNAGEYDPKNNRIVVNPKAEKKQELILIHELDHTIRAYLGDDGKIHYITYKDADKKVSKEKWEQIKKDYADQDIEVTREELFADEASAYYTEELIGTDKFIDLLLGKEPSLAKKILNFFTGAARAYSKDAKLSKEARRHYKRFKKMFDDFAKWNQGRNAETAVESVGDGKATRKSSDAITPKIKAGMSDDERYEVLKDRALKNIPTATGISADIMKKIPEISSWDDLNTYFGKSKKKLIARIAKEFGVIGRKYFNDDTQLSFEFSNRNFGESYDKQKHNYAEFAKMFSVFDEVVENAIGVEVHNKSEHKFDPTLDGMFVLMSAYQDGEFVVPVKLEVKKFKDKQNTLYVAISLEKIKMTELYARGDTKNGVTQRTRSVNISIANIFKKINPSDKTFLKYIPDKFLTEVQLKAKNEAITADRDSDYLAAVEKGDMKTVQRMIYETAKAAGYTEKELQAINVEPLYDDAGKAVPLSERFNPENKAFRYSKDIEAKLGEGAIESVDGRDAKVGARRASVLSRRRADMTVGQMRQMIARYTGDKVYTSKEARETMKIELQKPSMQAILRLTSSFFSAIIKCKT